MAGLNSKFKAATLVEALVAMVIIVLCLGFAVMIYENVLSSDKQLNKQKAIFTLNEAANKSKKEKRYVDEQIQLGEWSIIKTVTKYEQTENLYQLKLALLDSRGKIILTRNELVTKK